MPGEVFSQSAQVMRYRTSRLGGKGNGRFPTVCGKEREIEHFRPLVLSLLRLLRRYLNFSLKNEGGAILVGFAFFESDEAASNDIA